MKKRVDVDEAIILFRSFEAAFPQYAMTLDLNHREVEVSMDIRAQEGLPFPLNLNLQGDELHICAGEHFWLEWFPCTDPLVFNAYQEAVRGLLSGRFRILEHYRGQRAFKACLQRPSEDRWESIGTWSRLHLWLPWRSTTAKVLQATSVA
jgi:hypothetical protein